MSGLAMLKLSEVCDSFYKGKKALLGFRFKPADLSLGSEEVLVSIPEPSFETSSVVPKMLIWHSREVDPLVLSDFSLCLR